jgi:uncharacterized repeat protein (TIGR03803 family)
MFRTEVTETLALAGFAPAGKPANRRERFCSTRNSVKRVVSELGKLDGGKRACAVLTLCAATAIALPAQTVTTLFSFDYTDGSVPTGALVQATDGNLYGTTYGGGAKGGGTVFKITPGGAETTLYSFCSKSGCTDGSSPSYAGLVQATNGNFYGTTTTGGANCTLTGGCGTVFKITPSGKLTTLHSFAGYPTDGAFPYGGLVQASNGDFYGTTQNGGASAACSVPGATGCGTVFTITPSGKLTTLHSFGGSPTDGAFPLAALVQATNGDFYGTTFNGGASSSADCSLIGTSGCGTVFKMTASGELTTLHSFAGYPTDGALPNGLVQATNRDFYGTTASGGANCGTGGCGTVFKMTASGELTTLHSFAGYPTDGAGPFAGLVQATNGDLYGTTNSGGDNGAPNGGDGTVFQITPGGALTTLYSFCSQGGTSCTDGADPQAALVQDTNGMFYGTAIGVMGDGTVFSLSVGLGPFVETQTTSGEVGAVIKILGTDLTGATSVSFHGTAAVFTTVSPSLITTTVPAGATTGKVEVVTPSGTLSSNMPFRVRP